jgi:hypothetical protein
MATYNTGVQQGATFRRALRFKNGCTSTDLTTYQLEGRIRTGVAGELVANFTIVDVDRAHGRVDLVLTDEETALFPVGSLVYELDIINGGGERNPDGESPLSGTFLVAPRVAPPP